MEVIDLDNGDFEIVATDEEEYCDDSVTCSCNTDRKEELIEYIYHATEIDLIQAKLNQIKAKTDELANKDPNDIRYGDIEEAMALRKEVLDLQADILAHQAELKEFLEKELELELD